MTYAQKFKAKVAEVMPSVLPIFQQAINEDMSKTEIVNSIYGSQAGMQPENELFFSGFAQAICAVIDHEQSQNS